MRYYRVLEYAGGQPRTIVFQDDLESGAAGWTTTINDGLQNTQWQLGTPAGTTGPSLGADDSANAWCTNLGDYGLNSDVSLRSPAMDLSGVASADLIFAAFRDGDGIGDTAVVRFLRALDLVQLGSDAVVDMTILDLTYTTLTIPVDAAALGGRGDHRVEFRQ